MAFDARMVDITLAIDRDNFTTAADRATLAVSDERACDGGGPLVSDACGSLGGSLESSTRVPSGGGLLRSRCGCMMTSFSGAAVLGLLDDSGVWFG